MKERVIAGSDGVARCPWAGDDPLYRAYHDEEWGLPVHDDTRLFEKICLEGFQAGLSWLTILRKRENFRRAFLDFDFARVARFRARDVARLMSDAGIVRHRGKIESTINNARRALEMQRQHRSLGDYFWRWNDARALARDLKARGWTFVGPATVHSFMQAMGMVNDHLPGCDAYARVERARKTFATPETSTLEQLIRDMSPLLHDGAYVFCALRAGEPVPSAAVATFAEDEAMTIVIDRRKADALGLTSVYLAAWITLGVHSDLDAIGFLAAISRALTAAGISCNVFSAVYHDHLFVPYDQRERAMDVFRALAAKD